MGWPSGSELFSVVIKVIKPAVASPSARRDIYMELIAAFEDQDWDTLEECMGQDPAYDAALKDRYPDDYGPA